MKWIRVNGGTWTSDAVNWAAKNGHLETLKWIRANGGEWPNGGYDVRHAADWAARHVASGPQTQLILRQVMVTWRYPIRANGGE